MGILLSKYYENLHQQSIINHNAAASPGQVPRKRKRRREIDVVENTKKRQKTRVEMSHSMNAAKPHLMEELTTSLFNDIETEPNPLEMSRLNENFLLNDSEPIMIIPETPSKQKRK